MHGMAAWPPHLNHFSATPPVLQNAQERRGGWSRRVPSKHLSPFALLSSSTVLGWPQRLSDYAPAPGQRCMDIFPNTWGHPGSARLHLEKPQQEMQGQVVATANLGLAKLKQPIKSFPECTKAHRITRAR